MLNIKAHFCISLRIQRVIAYQRIRMMVKISWAVNIIRIVITIICIIIAIATISIITITIISVVVIWVIISKASSLIIIIINALIKIQACVGGVAIFLPITVAGTSKELVIKFLHLRLLCKFSCNLIVLPIKLLI